MFVTLLRERKKKERKRERRVEEREKEVKREKERRRERENGESIIRRCIRMPLLLDFRARHHVTSALNEGHVIINITHLNMLIMIINRAHSQDRSFVACLKLE